MFADGRNAQIFAALLVAYSSGFTAQPNAAPLATSVKHISDAELLAYVHSRFEHRSKMGKHEILGLNGKAIVVVDFPCSDLCPQYTARIIHYEVPAEARACRRAGGVIRREAVPVGIGTLPLPFCVPKVVADAEASRPH